MILPTTSIPPSRTTPKILTIYGQPKVGKTTAISYLPNCLIIECDPGGADFLTNLRVQVSSIKELRELRQMMALSEHKYDYIAVDTITTLEEWCEGQATEDYRRSPMGKNFSGHNVVLDLDFGKGYGLLREAFKSEIYALLPLAKHIILVGHIKEKYLSNTGDAKKTVEVSSLDLDLTGKCRQIICAMSDAVGYMFRDRADKKLKMSFDTKDELNCGNRCPQLAGKIIDITNTEDWKVIYG